MKRLIIFILAALICTNGFAGQPTNAFPRMTFGLEWGGSATLFTSYHFNYICSEGYRLDVEGRDFVCYSNADILGTFGMNITDWLNFSVFSGFEGISSGRRIIPIGGRATFYSKGYSGQGMMLRAGAGLGISASSRSFSTSFGLAGIGYHVPLSRSISLDFIFGYKVYLDTPPVEDIEGGYVPERDIRKDIATYHALNFSIGLNF